MRSTPLLLSLLLFSSCATTHVSPRMGACIVTEVGGDWTCADSSQTPVTQSPSTTYVCYKSDDWRTLMQYCRRGE